MSQASLNSVLRKVLSAGNKEANQMYPPHIYEEHYNITTNFIIDECVRLYPTEQSVVDIIRPFLKVKFAPLKNGVLEFPEDYRNLLGAAINVNDSTMKPCDCEEKIYPNDPLALTKAQLDQKKAEVGCRGLDIVILDITEFNHRSRHPYKKPSTDKFSKRPPIGGIYEGRGIKICPYDISHAEMYYVRKPKEYQFGYTLNPDDTYVFNPLTSTESEWEDTALQYLIKGISSLYAIYTRDGEMRDWTLELKKIGLF